MGILVGSEIFDRSADTVRPRVVLRRSVCRRWCVWRICCTPGVLGVYARAVPQRSKPGLLDAARAFLSPQEQAVEEELRYDQYDLRPLVRNVSRRSDMDAQARSSSRVVFGTLGVIAVLVRIARPRTSCLCGASRFVRRAGFEPAQTEVAWFTAKCD